jgi:2-polyprenyl-3-methyl-5-hydroxy-6-metoxy-1,4-benzoquinol methylase
MNLYTIEASSLLLFMDNQQHVFEDFAVPDPIRIDKAIGLIRRSFPELGKLRVLECGIARGGVADRLVKEGAACFGVDINPRVSAGITITQRDINDGLPDVGAPFDVIFAGEVMEHLFDEKKFLDEAFALLKPGGLLVLTVPNLLFSANRVRMFFGKMPLFAYAPYHYHMYNKQILTGLLRASQFQIAGFRSSHLLFSARRNPIGRIFEWLGDIFPSLGAHLIVAARKPRG